MKSDGERGPVHRSWDRSGVFVGVTGTENGVSAGVEQFLQVCEIRWPAGAHRPQVIARAPGRLDCMGGMADFSGALALQMPIDHAAFVAVGKRDDQHIRIESLNPCPDAGPATFEWPIARFYESDGQLMTGQRLARGLDACPWARHVAGVLLALLESSELPHLAGGLTLLLQSDIPPRAGLAASAAIEVATARAVAALFGLEVDARRLAEVCRTAGIETVGAEPGLVDHLTCLLGEADQLLQIRCQPDDVLGPVALPSNTVFVGVDIGMRLPIYAHRYADNRASSLLGKCLIDRLLQRSGRVGDPTGGYLANISPSEYVRRFRNELPVKIKGKDFVTRFGQPDTLDVQVDPDRIYKVRSRTEHHIYENDRAHRLVERLARARRTGERDALVEAGELMYASHWSYGQRCGMASIETDVLVNNIRQRGAACGLYGAKVTGGGCGGTVAVLMAQSDQAHETLAEACDAFAQKTRLSPRLIQGSSSGAMAFGCRTLD